MRELWIKAKLLGQVKFYPATSESTAGLSFNKKNVKFLSSRY